jgi:1L-myo-inositol 1-phosphate cytidylyltransferase
MTDTAVILAAGMGSRLAPSGNSEQYSKPLMTVGGKTLLERTVGCCRAAGARRVIVVTGFRHELVTAEAERLGVETVHNPDWKKANGLSLYVCRATLAAPFALMMSDHVFDPTILADLLALDPPAGSVTLAVDHKIDQIFDLDDATKVVVADGKIVQISKTLPSYNAIDCGLFLCTPAIFDALGEVVARKGDASLSEGMAIVGGRGQFVPFDIGDRWWQDVDTPEMLEQAANELARRGYLD